MKILVINSGSSSQKCSLYEIENAPPDEPPSPVWESQVDWDSDEASIRIQNSQGFSRTERSEPRSRRELVEKWLKPVWEGPGSVLGSPSQIDVVGHRVVHGGAELREATSITPDVKASISRLSVFAPLHNRAAVEGMELAAECLGNVAQVAVFDTGFHSRLPEPAAVYPGPYDWLAQGIRRYGFHGINHRYCAGRAAGLLGLDLASTKFVTCHLGNGCSLAAVLGGQSVDTTMGFTPLEGLMMGTRSGSVDPGIVSYLLRENRLTGDELDELLNSKSGLLGVSGLSADMRKIVAAMKNGHARAKLAFEIYVHRLRAGIGAMVTALGGIDALVFTAGVGENSAEVRAAACANFRFLGLELDATRNAQALTDQDISTRHSAVRILVIRAREDWSIARDCWNLVSSKVSATN